MRRQAPWQKPRPAHKRECSRGRTASHWRGRSHSGRRIRSRTHGAKARRPPGPKQEPRRRQQRKRREPARLRPWWKGIALRCAQIRAHAPRHRHSHRRGRNREPTLLPMLTRMRMRRRTLRRSRMPGPRVNRRREPWRFRKRRRRRSRKRWLIATRPRGKSCLPITVSCPRLCTGGLRRALPCPR